jgi:hypothetical protein
MTPFNPKNKDELTYAEALKPAMGIKNKEDAVQYLQNYVTFIQNILDKAPRNDEMTAEQIAKINLGYFAGYYNKKTRLRIEKFFMCEHPIFGKASEGLPTPQEAFDAGIKSVKV